MGIPHLNKLLVDKCKKDSIHKMYLRDIENKTIVIDTSIYLYKFLGQDKLIEHFYLLISLLLYYKITPIFVFDGKPPSEKMDTLRQRKQNKKDAEHKFYELQESISDETTEEEKKSIMNKMESLKKDFIRIRDCHIQCVKRLMELHGVSYIHAPEEADVVCCEMVINGTAWACLSDDMDMFLYGCTRVLRFISLLNHSVVMYDTVSILRDLDMNLTEFRYFTVPCGTDYNVNKKLTLQQMFKNFANYKNQTEICSFDDYLIKKSIVEDVLYDTCELFCISKNNQYDIIQFDKQTSDLRTFLQSYGFIFV